MEFGARRVTRSSLNENESGLAAAKQSTIGGKDAGATRRALVDQKNTIPATRNVVAKAVAPVKFETKRMVQDRQREEQAALIRTRKQVQKPAIERATDNKPELVGIEREMHCAEFYDQSHEYLMARERINCIPEDFMASASVTTKMRSILVDWLVQVHQRFHLVTETLHLTVYLVDCVLCSLKVDKTELQLVGVACMLVASKYEETYAADIADFEFITDNTFSKKQIIKMEMKVLHAAGFDLSRPHSMLFVRWLSMELSISSRHYALGKYFADIALLDAYLASRLPSHVGGAAIFLGARITGFKIESKQLCAMTKIDKSEFVNIVKSMCALILKLNSQEKLVALKQKYQTAKMLAVSNMADQDIEKLQALMDSL